jgi:hypothetical protein
MDMDKGTDLFSVGSIGVDGEEIGATRHKGATILTYDGIIPPMNGSGTRLTLADYF